jgi:hypothetical protein
MIRFTCPHCSKPVRVPAAHGGKKGRCPHCKDVVHIPAPAEPEPAASSAGDEVDQLAAALGVASATEPSASGPAPPPPHSLDDQGEHFEPDLELPPAADPRSKTDRLPPIREEDQVIELTEEAEEPSAAPAETPAPPPAMQAAPPERRGPAGGSRGKLLLLLAVVVLAGVAVAGGAATFLFWRPWESSPADTQEADSAAAPAGRNGVGADATAEARPEPLPDPPVPAPAIDLPAALLSATEELPGGTFGLLHVDFARLAEGLDRARSPAAIAARFWNELLTRGEDGRLPAPATLLIGGDGQGWRKLAGSEAPEPSPAPPAPQAEQIRRVRTLLAKVPSEGLAGS